MRKQFQKMTLMVIIAAGISCNKTSSENESKLNVDGVVPENIEAGLELELYKFFDDYDVEYALYQQVTSTFAAHGSRAQAEQLTTPSFNKKINAAYEPYRKGLDSVISHYPHNKDRILLKMKKIEAEEYNKRR